MKEIVICLTAVFCAGCTLSIHAGYALPQSERAYLVAISKPMKALSAASSQANRTCVTGSNPNPVRCYSDTKVEINDAYALQKATRSVRVPTRFIKGNRDFVYGLSVFIKGLLERNDGLANHSANTYLLGDELIRRGLALQRLALTEYPADAHV